MAAASGSAHHVRGMLMPRSYVSSIRLAIRPGLWPMRMVPSPWPSLGPRLLIFKHGEVMMMMMMVMMMMMMMVLALVDTTGGGGEELAAD